MGAKRIKAFAAATSMLLLCSCGPRSLTLPEDPIERAATCGAVAAASARLATGAKAPLSLEAISGVLHYPMLAGSAGASFSSDAAAKVQSRMAELQDKVAESKWQELVPACKAAFPAAAIEKPSLPSDEFEAQLGCDELGDFLRSSLKQQDEYENELGAYRQLSFKLDPVLGSKVRTRAGGDLQAQRQKALAAMANAGPPVAVMRQCLARFG